MLSSDVPVMLAVTGNTVQEFGKIEFKSKKDHMTGAFEVLDISESLKRIGLCSVHPTMYHLFLAVEKSPPNAFI